MKRKIIIINEEKCNGCGICVSACHEGAIGLTNGKAHLLKDDYCDGLGDCLPSCPTGAISFEEREANEYNEDAVKQKKSAANVAPFTCPGTRMKSIEHKAEAHTPSEPVTQNTSQLAQWPVQIKLVAPNAPYFQNANLLVAADCTAFARADFHARFMKNKITIIGCPKLDNVDYSQKLSDILTLNNIKSLTVVRMEVPCCGGIVDAVKNALITSGKMIPWRVVTISTDGEILEE